MRTSAEIATRGEFAPPSLRRRRGCRALSPLPGLRGANSPLPHCGRWDAHGAAGWGRLRGANSPLPHCGDVRAANPESVRHSTRGEFAPPSLRRRGSGRGAGRAATYEGRIRPSLIAALPAQPPVEHAVGLRGANSPLPHCGSLTRRPGNEGGPTTRGEFAPPSLRPTEGNKTLTRKDVYEGRIRPSLIAAR